MEKIELEAEIRTETGKGAMRRLRASGMLPGVLYGQGDQNHLLKLPVTTLERMYDQNFSMNVPINLVLKKGKEKKEHTVFIKEIQQDPVTENPLHIDFYAVSLKQKVTVPISISVIEKPECLIQGGILQQHASEIMAEGLVTDIPRSIEVDLSGLEIGDSFSIGQLVIPKGLKVLDSEEKVLFHVLSSQKVYLE